MMITRKRKVHRRPKILADIQRFLDERQPRDFRLDVVPSETKRENDWWYVVVRPTPESVRSDVYASVLVDAEEAFQEAKKVKVLLVPMLAMD